MRSAKATPVMDFSKGLITALTPVGLDAGASPEIKNLELYEGIARRTRGINPFSASGLVGKPLLIDQYSKLNGATYQMVVTTEKLYRYNTSSKLYDVVGVYAGTDPRNVFSTIYVDSSNDYWILTDGENNIKQYDGTTFQDNAALLAASIKAKTVMSFWTHLLLGFTVESGTNCPQRVRWNDTGDLTNWTTGVASFWDLVETPDFVVSFAPLMDRMFIYKERSIWELGYVGSPKTFIYAKVIDGVGLVAPGTLENIGGYHIFLASDGVYMFDGRSVAPIDAQIRDLLFGHSPIVNPNAIEWSKGIYIEEFEEYWLSVPTGSDTVPYDTYRYHFPTKSWWPRKHSKPVYCYGVWFADQATTWSDLTGTWNEQSWHWDDETVAEAFPLTLLGTFASTVGIPWDTGAWDTGAWGGGDFGFIHKLDPLVITDDGVSPEAYWDTPDFSFGLRARWLQFQVEAEGNEAIELFYSKNEGTDWTSLGTKDVTVDWSWLTWTFNLTSEKMRFRIKFGSGDIAIRKRIVWYQERVR